MGRAVSSMGMENLTRADGVYKRHLWSCCFEGIGEPGMWGFGGVGITMLLQ